MNKKLTTTEALIALAERFSRNLDYAAYSDYFIEIAARLKRLDELTAKVSGISPWATDIRWSRIVANENGFSNGRFYYFDQPVEVVRKEEVTSKPGPTPETTGEDLAAIREQAEAWREVANCLYDIDPDWHQTGKPMHSAVQFIKRMRVDRMYAEAFGHIASVVNTATTKDRQCAMSPLFAAPYGEKREQFQTAEQIREASANATPCQWAADLRDSRPMNYGKAPGEHPADIGGDQT
jgi:hypothetical protein